jgi:predicted AlkP superfamily phosphohydrolase/phosphomutase
MSTRVLFVGFDSLDKDLVLQWAESGILPTFRALLKNSAYGAVQNPPGLYGGAVWPSFATGLSPAGHGHFYPRQVPRGAYVDTEFFPSQQKGRTFWETLSRVGRKVAVLDIPFAPLASQLNGIQLVNWATHDPSSDSPSSYPPALAGELEEKFGRQPADHCDRTTSIVGYKAFVRSLRERSKNKLAIARQCLEQDSWDLFAVGFSEAHCVGHQCWHLHDPAHPRHNEALAAELGDPLKEIYAGLDDALAGLIEAAGADAMVVVLASHGMGPLYRDESIVLDEILRRLDTRHGSPAGSWFRRLKRCWYSMPSGLRGSALLQEAKAKLLPSLHRSMLIPDRHARRFFTIPYSPHAGAVRVNVVGREAHGLVERGEEYREICERLRSELSALVNAETGAPVVGQVWVTAELFSGPCLDDLPDIVVEWSRQEPVRAIYSPRIGTVKVPELKWRTGDHRNRSLFIARGTPFRAMALERPVPVTDLGPTIAMLLGVRLDGIDGKPIRGLTGF